MNLYPDQQFSYGDFLREYNRQVSPPHTVEDARAKRDEPSPLPREPIEQKHPRRKRKRKKGKVLVAVLGLAVALLCGVALVADFYLPQGVVGWVESVGKVQANYLYAVAKIADDLDSARTTSAALRSQGAGGFVAFDGSYYVILSVYSTLSEAEGVAVKGNYVVYPLSTDGVEQNDFPISLRNKVKDILSYPTDVYRSLYQLSVALQEGTVTVPQAKTTAYNVWSALSSRTESFRSLSSASSDGVARNYLASLTAVLAALDNLAKSKQEGALYLADVRWTYTFVIRVNRI